MAGVWQTTRFRIDLTQPQVMGIVNVTPDSFSDGGQYAEVRAAVQHAERLLTEGATLLDIGAESTRPGATVVPAEEELRRLLPVLHELLRLGVPISIDTYKPEVMQAGLALGVDIINDVWALRYPAMAGGLNGVDVVAAHPTCGMCLMHMHLEPQTMQVAPMCGDVLPQVADFLQQRAQVLLDRGVSPERLLLDYGIGFGKTVSHNLSLLARQTELLALGYPLLAGWSRKSTLGQVTGHSEPKQRVAASVAAALLAVERGASVVRVHDVRDTVDAIRVWQAMNGADLAR